VDYEIPVALTAGKSSIRVTFDALEGHVAGGLYHLRLMSDPGRAGRLRYEQVLVADIDAGNSASESKYRVFVSGSSTSLIPGVGMGLSHIQMPFSGRSFTKAFILEIC
jgi:hypothetical protein